MDALPRPHLGAVLIGLLTALALALALAACGPVDAPRVDEPPDEVHMELHREVVGDAAVFPGGDAPVVGAVARSQQRADALWTATGFTEDPPRLADDEVLLIVAGGESGSCPWRLPSVMLSADGGTVRFELGDHDGEPCTDDWNPRAIAVTVADATLDEVVDLEIAYRGTIQPAEPIDPDEVPAAFDGDTEPVAAEPTDLEDVALLRDVRVEAHPGWHPASGSDRVTFLFEDEGVPGFDVAYAEPPFHRDPSGEPVEIPGEVFLEVRLEPASGHVEDREPAYEGPDRVTARTPAETEAILEATLVADHEAAMTWVVGITDEERPFRVEADPETGLILIEVAREPAGTP